MSDIKSKPNENNDDGGDSVDEDEDDEIIHRNRTEYFIHIFSC